MSDVDIGSMTPPKLGVYHRQANGLVRADLTTTSIYVDPTREGGRQLLIMAQGHNLAIRLDRAEAEHLGRLLIPNSDGGAV